MGSVVQCATCGVEHVEPIGTCAICADERQWVPAAGQAWTSLRELRETGHRVVFEELENGLLGLTVEPIVGIGQQSHLVSTPQGSVLWDVPPFLDRPAVDRVRKHGPVLAIVASHPHMFGVQSAWSHALEQAPILVCEPLLDWVQRPDSAITGWRGRYEIAPGLVLHELGGHFSGSSVLHWAGRRRGARRAVQLRHDPRQPRRRDGHLHAQLPEPDPAVGRGGRSGSPPGSRVCVFERMYDNFGRGPKRDADAAVQRSAERYASWVRGDFDELT